jgi:hypothetical protein
MEQQEFVGKNKGTKIVRSSSFSMLADVEGRNSLGKTKQTSELLQFYSTAGWGYFLCSVHYSTLFRCAHWQS